MNGREVFKHAVRTMADMLTPALAKQGLKPTDISWLVPHQANSRILLATAQHLGLPPERVILTVGEHANTSAASIPLALQHGVAQNCFKPGEVLVLEAFGAGFTWGNALIRW
jgi:3-oxoacyl-[acyl-carrier-protein] synthase-3